MRILDDSLSVNTTSTTGLPLDGARDYTSPPFRLPRDPVDDAGLQECPKCHALLDRRGACECTHDAPRLIDRILVMPGWSERRRAHMLTELRTSLVGEMDGLGDLADDVRRQMCRCRDSITEIDLAIAASFSAHSVQ